MARAASKRRKDIGAWFWARVEETGFLDRYPDFAPILAGVEVVEANYGGGIMGVSRDRERILLHVSTAAFAESLRGFRAILQHEMHHVLLGHVTDDRYRIQGPHAMAMTLACELSANEGITEPLPGSPVVIADYEEYGVRPGQTTLERYELLVRAMEDGRLAAPPRTCKVCAGHGEDDLRSAWATAIANLHAELAAAGALDGTPGRETRSDELELPDDPEPATISWRARLQRFARREPERRPTLRRPNRRDPTCARIGELPGWSRLGGRPKLLVAIDTSGSMPDDLFPAIAGEVESMSRHADLVIVECDAAIRREYAYRGRLGSVEGRGGTDLSVVFEREVLARHRADGVVYFTDGLGPYPEDDPRIDTLWVLTDDAPFGCPWGQKVRMDGGRVRSGPAHRRRRRRRRPSVADLIRLQPAPPR